MAGEEITIDNLRQLLSIQTDLREQAETRWRKAQRVLVSLLETFAPEEVDQRLHRIMVDIHRNCQVTAQDYGVPGNYVVGANIAGFVKVAEAMQDQGLV